MSYHNTIYILVELGVYAVSRPTTLAGSVQPGAGFPSTRGDGSPPSPAPMPGRAAPSPVMPVQYAG